MPSGITHDIYEGKDVSLRDYLMRVARSYTLAIMQREDDPDAPVRRDEADTKYHDEKITEAEAALIDLAGLSLEEASERAEADHKEQLEAWKTERDKRLAMRSRYEQMIEQVEAWEPEPLVAYLKDGALKQLRESLDFDCGEPGQEMKYRAYPRLLSGGQWLQEQIAQARKDIERSREQIAKRQKIAAERNEHIDAFYRSLPDA